MALFSILLVAGCGTSEDKGTGSTNNGEEMAASGMVQTISELEDHKYKLTIENNTEDKQILTFSSSQNYEYQIKDAKGTVLYTYSATKSFAQAIAEKELEPGEVLEFELDASEALPMLEKGNYSLEAWVTANEVTDKATIEFSY